MNAGGHFLANLRQPGIDLGLRRLGCLRVLLANLLLDERAADQLLQGALARENAQAAPAGSRTESRISSSTSLARMAWLLTTATTRSSTTAWLEASVPDLRRDHQADGQQSTAHAMPYAMLLAELGDGCSSEGLSQAEEEVEVAGFAHVRDQMPGCVSE